MGRTMAVGRRIGGRWRIAVLVLVGASVGGCHTIAGVGRDLEDLGRGLTTLAESAQEPAEY